MSKQAFERKQKFEINQRVYQVLPRFGPDGKRIFGTITRVFLMGTMYRYVVKFDDDLEAVFFDFEILAE